MQVNGLLKGRKQGKAVRQVLVNFDELYTTLYRLL